MWKACMDKQHLLSKSQCCAWQHGLCSLHCSWPCSSATWHSYHFGSRFLVTTWSQILQLLQTGAEIWAQFLSCSECWVHPVCRWWCWPKLEFSGCPITFHGMGDIANILPGKPTLWGNPTLNCENGLATSCLPHLDLQFLYIFCGTRLTETQNT